ncbi:MAG TPA: HPr-rel-A system PqqD family peptide chaperone [Sphingomonas sp.]|nr:HPr-rel-A system PqqD family peptide chaperone [Sphingomonas sp.]
MTRYARVPADELSVVPLDDFTAIYHRASGITHLVTSPVPELLEVLGEEAIDLKGIGERLTAMFEVEEGGALAARLDELVAVGLVIRA